MNLEGLKNVPHEGPQFCREFAARVLARHGIPMSNARSPEEATDWVKVSSPKEMDVVVFNQGGEPAHVGVCIGRGRFVHVEEGSRSRIERLSSPLYKGAIEGFYRFVGVKECV